MLCWGGSGETAATTPPYGEMYASVRGMWLVRVQRRSMATNDAGMRVVKVMTTGSGVRGGTPDAA